MIRLAVLVIVLMAAVVAVALIAIASRPPRTPTALLLEQHAQYTGKAARASRRGKDGEMNVWNEAARDLWKQVEYNTAKTVKPEVKRLALVQRPEWDVESRIPAHLLERAAEARRRHPETS